MSGEKISSGQLLLILLLSRLMHTMIYRFNGFTSGTPMMLGLLVGTLIEGILALPAVLWLRSCRSDPAESFGAMAAPVRFLYSLYFTVIAGGTAALFAEFLENEFSGTVSPLAATAILGIAAAYCGSLGIEGLSRAATVAFWLFAALFVTMAAVNEGSLDALNLRPLLPGDAGTFWKYLVESLSSSWWIPMLCCLGGYLKSGAAKAAYGYLAMKFTIIGALLGLITLILWKYIGVLKYPIFALGAYAKSDFIQRFDAINMLVWALICTLVIAVYYFIASRPLKSRGASSAAFALLATVFAAYQYRRGIEYDEPWFIAFKLAGIAILGIGFPTAAGIIKLIKHPREAAP